MFSVKQPKENTRTAAPGGLCDTENEGITILRKIWNYSVKDSTSTDLEPSDPEFFYFFFRLLLLPLTPVL
jgi:hypothetical protein